MIELDVMTPRRRGVLAFVTADHQGEATVNLSDVVSRGFALTDERVDVTCQAASGDVVFRQSQP